MVRFLSLMIGAMTAFPAMGQVDLLKQYAGQLSVVEYLPTEKIYGLLIFKKSYFENQLGTRFYSPGHLENDYFKVVENDSDEVLPITDLEGRNVFYHLNKARDYFLNIDPSNRALEKKITVRVRVERGYNLVDHFAAETESYNNSRYIPSNYRGRWKNEMWFHKSKSSNNWLSLVSAAVGVVWKGPVGLASVPFTLARFHDVGMESALIPSVIYHEAFHWASDDPRMLPTLGYRRTLSEDLADYFATSLLDDPVMAGMSDFASNGFRRDFSRVKQPKLNKSAKLTPHDYPVFLPALLWKIRRQVGQPNTDQLVWNALREMGGAEDFICFENTLTAKTDALPALKGGEAQFIKQAIAENQSGFDALAKMR